jgi:hypothetical protein
MRAPGTFSGIAAPGVQEHDRHGRIYHAGRELASFKEEDPRNDQSLHHRCRAGP